MYKDTKKKNQFKADLGARPNKYTDLTKISRKLLIVWLQGLTTAFESTDNIWIRGKGKEKTFCNFQLEHASLQERVLWALVMSEVGLELKVMPSSPTCQDTMLPVAQKL